MKNEEDRLAAALRPVIADAGQRAGVRADRDIAVVLRRLEEGARGAADLPRSRAYLDLIGRMLKDRGDTPGAPDDGAAGSAPRLIIQD